MDFYNQIKDINIKYQNKHGKKIIELKYFKETGKQINDYFATAISIVEENQYSNNDTAMESIIRGCKSRSDVSDKESDFFSTLEKSYEIYEETNDNFFINDNHTYNLDFLSIEKLFNIKDPEMDSNKIKIYTNIIQHINVLRKELQEPYKFVINISDYKEQREKSLIKLANNIAREVKESKVDTKLDSMNSYERRIIHNALLNNPYVYTESTGEEPNRYIIIKAK